MAAFRNADGIPLNVSQAVQNDEDARNLAAHLRGRRRDPYYEPMRSLSSQDEEVHEVYEALYDIVNNPENYTAEQINNTIVDILEENDSPVQKYGSFSGNYNADLADERNSPEVFKYYKSWKRNHKNWERRGKEMKGKKLAELKKLDKYKTPDDMPRDKKRKIRDELYEEVNEAYRKYMYGKVPLGRQIYYMIEKAEKIQEKKELGSDSDSSDDEDGGAAAVMKKPSSTEFEKMNNDEKEAAKRKKLAPLLAKMKLGSLKKPSAKPQAKPTAAVAMAKPAAKPKQQVKEMFGDKWIGPYMSKSKGIEYWVRMRDRLGVFVDSSTGKLTERNIRKTEEHNAKKAAKKGGRRTRKRKGRGKGDSKHKKAMATVSHKIPQGKGKGHHAYDEFDGKNLYVRDWLPDSNMGKLPVRVNEYHVFQHQTPSLLQNPQSPEGNQTITQDMLGGRRRRKKRGGDQGAAPVTFIVSNDNIAITGFDDNIKERQNIDLTFIEGNSYNGRDAITNEMRNSGLIGGWFIIKYDPNSENNAQFGHWQTPLPYVPPEMPDMANEIIAEDNIEIGNRFVIETPDQIGGKRRRKTRKMKGGHHLYKRLGVSKYASQKQIKKAYNKIKKKKKLTKKVKYAYKILSKKKSRKKYNAKYKKMKKSKRTRRRRGGIASIVIKGKMHPDNYEPGVNIPDANTNQPAWLGNL